MKNWTLMDLSLVQGLHRWCNAWAKWVALSQHNQNVLGLTPMWGSVCRAFHLEPCTQANEHFVAIRFKKDLPLCFVDNTAGILTRRSTFTRRDQKQYHLPVVVTDSGSPALSSTTTLTISVCTCQPTGYCPKSGVEALALSMGLSLQTLLGLTMCLITVIGKNNTQLQSQCLFGCDFELSS